MIIDVTSVANEDKDAKREKTSAVRQRQKLRDAAPSIPQRARASSLAIILCSLFGFADWLSLQVVVTLSKSGKGFDKKHIGYHAALPASEVCIFALFDSKSPPHSPTLPHFYLSSRLVVFLRRYLSLCPSSSVLRALPVPRESRLHANLAQRNQTSPNAIKPRPTHASCRHALSLL
jgi:hypothetical protein